jgi:thioredoxin 1
MAGAVTSLSNNNFDAAVGAGTPVLVDFWAPWCGPCLSIAPILDELASEYGGRLAVAKVNVDNEPDLAARYRVTGIPTLILFKDGEVAERITGARPKSAFKAVLDRYVA